MNKDLIETGATPVHIFNVDTDLTHATAMWITYMQNGIIRVNKTLENDNIEITADTVTVRLTQQDTLSFLDNVPVKIQIKCKFSNGNIAKSTVIHTSASECLNREEM